MPKVLQCSREDMLEKARSLLIERGYDACTMREVAAACGVSVGTMYTYFSSKDAMIVHAMAAEWFEVLDGVKSRCGSYADAVEGLSVFYEHIRRFALKYRTVFLHVSNMVTPDENYQKGSDLLLGQVRGVVALLLAPFGRGKDAALCDFLANVLLIYVQKAVAQKDDDSFAQIRPYIAKLLQ